MINIIHRCVFYVNIKVCIYYIVLKKLNITQIYSYHINIYFRLGFVGFELSLPISIPYLLFIKSKKFIVI